MIAVYFNYKYSLGQSYTFFDGLFALTGLFEDLQITLSVGNSSMRSSICLIQFFLCGLMGVEANERAPNQEWVMVLGSVR